MRHAFDRMDLGVCILGAGGGQQDLPLRSGDGRAIWVLVCTQRLPGTTEVPGLAGRLRRTWPDLPVLYMSGYPSTLVRDGGILDPSMRLLPKPFTPTELLAHVDEVLGGPAR